jgi:tRNA 5-methylaminomethyl-2-thiouridine biosynthesis bifunctional protein
MKRDNLPWRLLQPASLVWAPEPHSTTYDDVYFSRDNGRAESEHVFLAGNDLPQRLPQHPLPHFAIGETGFGTGLNFLLTWQAWRAARGQVPDLHYLSFEKHPLHRTDLARALALWPDLEDLAVSLLNAYPGPVPGQHRLLLDEGRVRLDLWFEDAAEALGELASREEALVDAWYLDGFAPDRNRDMWSPDVLWATAALSRPGATIATFTVAGHVRRALEEAGFRVNKVPGYGRKRECLRGTLERTGAVRAASDNHPHWDIPATGGQRPRSVIVLGAGLAGCTVAAALARRGMAVAVLEQRKLGGAVGDIDQGIIFTRLSRRHSSLSDFALQSFLFATGFYSDLFASGRLTGPGDGELCGSFQQSDNSEDLAELAEALTGLEDIARVLDARQASDLLGIEQPSAGFWFPRSGWLHPTAVCRALLDHPGIRLEQGCGELTLEAADGQWRALQVDDIVAEADCAVAAPGPGAVTLKPFTWLPVQTIRGQVTRLPADGRLEGLRAALCHEGYVAPAREGLFCVGATFEVGGVEPMLRDADHRQNLDKLAEAVPSCRSQLEAVDTDALGGAVGFRCASPDYLPMVGPAPDLPAFLKTFAPLRKNARYAAAGRGCYLPGLYLSTAHGSRGLTSAPLAAELLASMICHEPPPLSASLCRALAPARFIIRDLIRNRI